MAAEIRINDKDPNLGFGYMRLPITDGHFDEEETNRMVDAYMSHGFSYFDTGFIYVGSEEALHKSLVLRYPRERYQIATKVAIMCMDGPEGQQYQFDTSISRLGVDYVDFYLLHGLSGPFIRMADDYGSWDFLKKLKAEGKAKHIGFSFHGTPEELDDILSKHPEIEFVQLQINYLDWDNPAVQSRRLYEVARKYSKPISVMEPTKGGLLAGENNPATRMLKEVNPTVSAASWAFRFVAGLDGIMVILSGMGNVAQVEDNAKTFENFRPLSEEERALTLKVVEIINSTPRVPCTSCKYCVGNCPQKLPIPTFMSLYNDLLAYNCDESTRHLYSISTNEQTRAVNCIECHSCEAHCPQHIEITKYIKELVKRVDT